MMSLEESPFEKIPRQQPIPPAHRPVWRKLLMLAGFIMAAPVALLVLFVACDFVHSYQMPSNGMSPTISKGDHIYAESMTWWFREPKAEDIVVFTTSNIANLSDRRPMDFVQRIAAVEGDTIGFADQMTLINGSQAVVETSSGAIRHTSPGLPPLGGEKWPCSVPVASVFTLGDNTDNSFDGRYWGFLPKENIKYRACFCYWPLSRMGFIK